MLTGLVTTLALPLALPLALTLSGCFSPTSQDQVVETPREMPPPAPTTPVPAFESPAQIHHDKSGRLRFGENDPAELDAVAARGLVILQYHGLVTSFGEELVRDLRARNPEVVILGILDVLTVPDFWDKENIRTYSPMAGEIYDLFDAHTFETLEGDRALMWDGARMVNPIRGGEIKHDLVQAYVDVICRHAQPYPGMIDGVFYDYMSASPWMYPYGPDSGTLDLDGDGIPSHEDEQERALWAQWQVEVLREMQARWGEGFIQIANGNLGLAVPESHDHLAGVYFEKAPVLVWNRTPQQTLEMALDLMAPNGLTPRRGRTWVIFGWGQGDQPDWVDQRRMMSALTGEFYELRRGSQEDFPPDDPVQLDLGAAVQPLRVTEGLGQTIYTRGYENGTVRMVFDSGGRVQSAELVPPVGDAQGQ